MPSALEGTYPTKWKLTTLFGLHAGGYGNPTTIKHGKCAGLEGKELKTCKAKYAPKVSPSPGPVTDPGTGGGTDTGGGGTDPGTGTTG